MAELKELIDTAGGVVVETHLQKKDRPDPATFVGKGKAAELSERGAPFKNPHARLLTMSLNPSSSATWKR